jgi:hypothetical protein
MNILELDSFNLANAVKFHDRLNPLLWDSREHLHPEIHSQLIKIADDFRDSLGVNNLELRDITISGSNAAYSYTPHSDIDLHLIVDLSGVDHPEIYRELFDAKKAIYNGEHTITIKGIPVELYVQDAAQDHHSQGIYSIINNDWIQIPRRVQADIDDMSVRSKYADLSNRIDKVVKTEDLTRMDELAAKIKKMRQEGLAEHGEFGPENLVFKMLRNQGHIEQLRTARHEAKSKELSLKERVRKPKTIYGYSRDFVDEVAITPGGVSDHTKMFVEKDEEPANSQQKIIEDFIDFCSAQLSLAKEINLRIRRDPEWSVRNKTFGRYDQQTNELNVGVSGRHIMDILRTVAHELVHQRQNETQEMPPDAGADGSEYENEANAQAAVLMRRYGKLHPELFVPSELNEAFDQPYKTEWDKSDTGPHYSRVQLPDGTPLTIVFYNMGIDRYGVEFLRNRRMSINGEGDAPRIFATVLHDILEFVKKRKPQSLTFSADKDINDIPGVRANPNSRAKLYTRMVNRYAESSGYRVQYREEKDYVKYTLIRIEPKAMEGLNEASGYIPTAAEADDPRYEMALTVDIRPGALGKAANAFLLNTDSQGHPQELRTDGLVNRMMVEYSKFKQ